MAIESLELAIKLYGTPIYVYHEMSITYVVEFSQRGRSVRHRVLKCRRELFDV
jgi:hypothetical protein